MYDEESFGIYASIPEKIWRWQMRDKKLQPNGINEHYHIGFA
jgi:hypothetical protein